MKYSDKLKDPRWQKKRLEILNRDEWRCQKCGDEQSTLHVHHRRYIPERDPWDYTEVSLVTLCESCHEYETTVFNSCCTDLVSMARDKFFADGIYALTAGILKMEVVCYDSQVIANVYGWALSDPDIQKELAERYFKHLTETLKKVDAPKGG